MKLLHLDHYKQSTDYTCGPATLLSFLDYYDRKYTRNLNEKRLASRLNTCPSVGTSPKQLYGLLNEKSKQFTFKRNANLNDLKMNIDKDKPSIVLWFDGDDWHWSNVIGYNQKKIILLDSNLDDGINIINDATFNQNWSKLLIK